VRAGERWAVLGPNGSGKTTLLSLICGDHPQAYSNDITVFGRQRGAGESIWDVKRRIGLVSPEMHLYFTEPLTADRAAATGFFDVLVPRPTTAAQDAGVRELFTYFGIADLAGRPFGRLSSGQQRIVLLIRALVKDPPLLILDEPFQVLDAATQGRAREWIDGRLAPDRTVLFVTHNETELPRTVTRRLRLREGAAVEIS
jgi:molybdate transport system ATP-binding protein